MNKKKLIFFLIPFCLVFTFLVIKIADKNVYQLIIAEDAILEQLQVTSFLTASIFSLLISSRLYQKRYHGYVLLYGILCLGLLFIAGEEASWGQRIFDIETPGFFLDNNVQKEISVHNLFVFQSHLDKIYIFIGFYGSFAWLFFKKCKKRNLSLLFPDWYLSSYFLFPLLLYAYFEFLGPFAVNTLRIKSLMIEHFFTWRDQEPIELILALGFLLFTAIHFFRLQKPGINDISKNIVKTFNTPNIKTQKIQRNTKCPCGSGKKYKNCCFK